MISAGQVELNGQLVTALGTKVLAKDRIAVNGIPIKQEKVGLYYLLNKPVGVISTTRDERGRKSVLDLLDKIPGRVYPVGRLDFDTSGLLLLTNDGELTHRLTHPRFGVEKTYIAGINGPIGKTALDKLCRGVWLEDGKTAPAKVRTLGKEPLRGLNLLEITIHEGRNRQVRRMCQAVGLNAASLKRIRFGPLSLDRSLGQGEYRALTAEEILSLRRQTGLPS
jgi:23S rRNA pseudouridine2605 synthase